MAWILFYGSDLRDRDRLERAAAEAGLEVRTYSPGSWEALDPPDLVIVDLDRVGIPESLPEAVRAIGYFSHVNEDVEAAARDADILPVRRGDFWSRLRELIEG